MGEEEFSRPRKLDMFGEDTGLKLLSMECGENHCLASAEYDSNEKMLVGWGLNRHYQLDFKLG
jgi:alpha-tubulin suppressor-like RCC1 family protein